MRLRIGLALATFAVLALLFALPSTFYNIHVVGPNFDMVGPDGPTPEDEVRQLDGRWTLWSYTGANSTFQTGSDRFEEPLTVVTFYGDEGGSLPDSQALEVYQNTLVVVMAALVAFSLAAVGTWNVARHGRFQMFTAASFFLVAVLLLGGCFYFGTGLPAAMHADSTGGGADSFGGTFSPFIDPEGGEPGYYFEFSGGYPNQDPNLREQLQYGPGGGWWMAGAAGILALITAGVMVGAPNWEAMKEGTSDRTVEVVRYVPIPTATTERRKRKYPYRMPAISRNTPMRKRK